MVRRAAIYLLLLTLATLGVGTLAFGQKKPKAPTVRAVSGAVLNTDGTTIPGAIVQLKNLKSLEVRSFIAREKGEYYFNSLSTDIDYELKASWNGKSSSTRTVSSFDSHPDLVMNLQLK